jgi:outer membrane lipoprotein-sorting protein
MNNILEKLEQLNRAVPDAPEFAGMTMRRLPISLPARRKIRKPLAIAAMAACVLIGISAVLSLIPPVLSPEQAFGQVVQRVAQLDSVRYWVRPEGNYTISVDHRTFSSGGRRRSELGNSTRPSQIVIHNGKNSPELDLALYPDRKIAEFDLVDTVREAHFSEKYPDNPVAVLQQLATQNVKSAPDEIYQGKSARVFVRNPSTHPASNSGGTPVAKVVVDKVTGLPLRIEMDNDMGKEGIIKWVMEDFEWNPPIDDGIYSTQAPEGYKVVYNLIKPLDHGLGSYAAYFDGHLPDRVDSAELEMLKQRANIKQVPSKTDFTLADAVWGFRVPAFAAAHGIDFRYYGAGQSISVNAKDGKIIAAVETAPGSGMYDVLLSNEFRDRLSRSQLP